MHKSTKRDYAVRVIQRARFRQSLPALEVAGIHILA